ncbi:MAG: hypothetical protein ACTS4V_00260 [Candidatus Hodgkinia cicadicola]
MLNFNFVPAKRLNFLNNTSTKQVNISLLKQSLKRERLTNEVTFPSSDVSQLTFVRKYLTSDNKRPLNSFGRFKVINSFNRFR